MYVAGIHFLTLRRFTLASRRIGCAIVIASAFVFFVYAIAATRSPASAQNATAVQPPIWMPPEVSALPQDGYGHLVRRGRDLIAATYAHIGPLVANPAKRYAGNNLACANCHLNAGTKKFGLPIFGLSANTRATAPGQAPRRSSRIASINA